MKKLIAAIACLIALTGQAYPQASGASLQSQINTSWPDNTSQLITPLALRTVVTDIVKSILTNSGCPSELLGFASDGITPQCYSASVFPSSQTSTVIGNFSGSTAVASSQTVPFCASDGAHSLTNPGGAGFNCNAISGAVSNGLAWISPLSYNAAGIIETTSGSITSSGSNLTVASATGWSGSGQGIWVMGAGAAGADLVTTVASVTGTTIGLNTTAGTTVTNAVVGPTGAISSGHNSLTISNPTGWAMGQGIDIAGAGAAGADLITTITNIAGSTFTLAANASTNVTAAIVNHDDTAALSSTISAALAGNLPIYIPAGNYNVTSALTTVTGPMSIFGDGRFISTIWNRATTDTIFTYDYVTVNNVLGVFNSGAMIRDFTVSQAPDITPSAGGAWLFEAPTPGTMTGVSLHNILINEMWSGINVNFSSNGSMNDSTFENIVITNQIHQFTGTGAYGIYYNNPSPGGDNWFHNIAMTNSGINILSADSNSWSNIKITGGSGPDSGGSGLVFAGNGSNITDQRFINLYIENTDVTSGCNIDFGTNGVEGVSFIGGGLGALATNMCNIPSAIPQTVNFVGFQWGPGTNGTNFLSGVKGTLSTKFLNLFGDQTSNIFSGVADNGMAFSDPGISAAVLNVQSPGTNSQGHMIINAQSSSHKVWAVDAAGYEYDNGIVQNWGCTTTCTVGNIEIQSSNQLNDAATATTAGAVGILVATGGPNINGGGNYVVLVLGQANCNFDNTEVAGDYVTFSTTTAGECHDSGDSGNTRPTHGIGVVRANSNPDVQVNPW